MKSSLLLSLALALTPAAAFAQAAPAPPPPPPGMADAPAPTAAQRASMQQMHAQMKQLHVQVRSQILAALTPQHRTAVANLAGQLVLSANPDMDAAARQLDSVLSGGEKQSILTIAANAHRNMTALMQQSRAQMDSSMSADQRARMDAHMAKMQMYMQSHPRPEETDPGAIVLHTLGTAGGHPMHGMM